MPKSAYSKAVLIVAFIGFAISIGVGLNELYRNRPNLQAQHKINAWLMAQTELELERLVHTLDRYVSDVDPSSRDDLVMRFDIFWSRLPVLLAGSQSRNLHQLPDFEETVRRIQGALTEIESDVLSLRPDDIEDYHAIRGRLVANTGPLHDLVLAAAALDDTRLAAERLSVRTSYWQVALSIFGAFAGGAVFIALLSLESRRTRRLLRIAKEAEHDAREARLQLNQAIESISEGFTLYDAGGKLLVFNEKLREIYTTITDLIVLGADYRHLCIEAVKCGQFPELTDPEEIARTALFDWASDGEHTAKLKDGRWVRITWRRTADGGVVGVHSDITELKNREAELAANSRRLQSTLDNISQGVGVFDAERRLTTRNEQFVDLIDLPSELGAKGCELDAILRFQAERGDFGRARAHGETYETPAAAFASGRFELDLPSGRVVEIECGAMPDGGIVATYTDITERRLAEEQRQMLMTGLHQSQKMQAIGTLAGGVAHDFNNVLASILGNAELALYDLDESHPAYESVVQIRGAGEHATNVVKQILAFSRHEPDEAKPLCVDQVLEESVKLLRATLPATSELIEKRTGDNFTIIGDATQINQIVMNLGVNANHAIGSTPGKITMELEAIDIDGGFAEGLASEKRDAAGQPVRIVADQDDQGARLWCGQLSAGPHLRLTVRDTGCGMSYQTVTRMFEPFFTTKDVGSGTGLGLSAIHGIVMKHGGAIVVESRLGIGTSFQVLLPRVFDEISSPPLIHGTGEGHKGNERVMVVDDNSAVLDAVCRTLRRAGFVVDGMVGGAEALEAFRSDPSRWSLILTDQTMPGMTGTSLAEEMLRFRPNVAIILCTGYSAAVDEQHAGDIGIREFVRKPIVGAVLTDMVRRVLDEMKFAEAA